MTVFPTFVFCFGCTVQLAYLQKPYRRALPGMARTALRAYAARSFPARPNIEGFVLPNGKTVYLLGEGRLVNLACGDGHPAEIMDMSFALQALCAEYIVRHGAELEKKTYAVPREIDAQVAALKLESVGVKIDTLTAEQEKYLGAWA